MLIVRIEELDLAGRELAAELQRFVTAQDAHPQGSVVRLRFDAESARVLGAAVRGLYGWRPPGRPRNLCLLRRDGTPWLVSVAAPEVAVAELTPFEKLRLSQRSPRLAYLLSQRSSGDAVMAILEQRLEGHLDAIGTEICEEAAMLMGDRREGVAAAMDAWLSSEEPARVRLALEVIEELELAELAGELERCRDAVATGEAAVPAIYARNAVLAERWRARHLRRLDEVLERLGTPTAA